MACRILGISAFYHDSAATLLCDGSVVAALQEERFSRKKNDPSFPARAVAAALRIGDCRPGQLDFVVFYEKPFLKFERLLETYLKHCPRGLLSYLKAMPPWLREKMWIKDVIRRHLEEYSGDILFADHHESHAASAFYPSPFPSAAVLTVDAVGEWTTTALGRGEHHRLDLDSELRFPHSLGLLYSAFTYYLGFKVNSGEYKLMGLAPYGRPTYTDQIRDQVVEIGEDGSLRLNLEFFDFEVGLKMTSRRFEAYFGGPPRGGAQPLTQRHKDLAASIQKVTEEALLAMCRHLKRRTAEKNLCMAGGLALNCVANGRVLRESDFENLWVFSLPPGMPAVLWGLPWRYGTVSCRSLGHCRLGARGEILSEDPCWGRLMVARRFDATWNRDTQCVKNSRRGRFWKEPPRPWRRAQWWHGFRVTWSSVLGLWARGVYWRTPGRRRPGTA